MVRRTAPLVLSAAFLLASQIGFGQANPPADVDQTLQARVTEFFQDFVDGKFRQAINLVADDTQDEYFGSPKIEMKGFKIDSVTYSDNFSQAKVKLTVKQLWRMKGQGFAEDTVVDTPMETTWKIENQKWVWSNHTAKADWLTPMGPSADIKPGDPNAVPKKLDDAALMARANEILKQGRSSLTPNLVTFQPGTASTAKLVFHNGVQGAVAIVVDAPPRSAGVSAKTEKRDLTANEDTIVEITYDPAAATQAPRQISMSLTVEPFKDIFPIVVQFEAPKQ